MYHFLTTQFSTPLPNPTSRLEPNRRRAVFVARKSSTRYDETNN